MSRRRGSGLIISCRSDFPKVVKPLVLILSLAFFAACSISKKVVSADKIKKKPTADRIVTYLENNRLETEGLTARAKVKYEDDYQSLRATLTLKMIADSLIWMSVKKLGYEAIRIKISRDSIYVLNRLEKELKQLSLSHLEQRFNVPANFSILSSLILGNPVLGFASKYSLSVDERSYQLFGNDAKYEVSYLVDKEAMLIRKFNCREIGVDSRFIVLRNEDYAAVSEDNNFSYLRFIELISKEYGRLLIDVKFSKVELGIPKSIRFEVPDKYKLVKD